MRIAAVSGAALYTMMWSVTLPPATNPVLDDHLINAALLIGLALISAGDALGFGRWWARAPPGRPIPLAEVPTLDRLLWAVRSAAHAATRGRDRTDATVEHRLG
jgi:hypothetical protein